MGAVNIWEVQSTTEFEAARGQSPQPRPSGRHRDITSASGVVPGGLARLCGLDWFPRFYKEGERRQFKLYQVSGIEGLTDGVYADPIDPAVKMILQRWFGDVA
jgi:hypothetical protein